MVKKKTKKIMRGIALTVIIASHGWMLFVGLPESQIIGHAIVNLIAGGWLLFNK